MDGIGETDEKQNRAGVTINHHLIGAVPDDMQAQELQDLGLTVYNQADFEEGVIAQVEDAIVKDEEVRTRQQLEQNITELKRKIREISREISLTDRRITALTSQRIPSSFKSVQDLHEKLNTQKQLLNDLKNEKKLTEDYLSGKSTEVPPSLLGPGKVKLPDVLQQKEDDEQIRLGEKTPFGTVVHGQEPSTSNHLKPDQQQNVTDFEKFLLQQSKSSSNKPKLSAKSLSLDSLPTAKQAASEKLKRPLLKNRFDLKSKSQSLTHESDMSALASKKQSQKMKIAHRWEEDGELSDLDQGDDGDGSDWAPDPHEVMSDDNIDNKAVMTKKGKRPLQKKQTIKSQYESSDDDTGLDSIKASFGVKKRKQYSNHRAADDGSEKAYKRRQLQLELEKQEKMEKGEYHSDSGSDAEFDGGFKVPGCIWRKLYKYQKTGVRWLWELHNQQAGGILGDEMGLGKTIQAIAFLRGLQYSGLKERLTTDSFNGSSEAVRYYKGLGPVLIVCPTTVLHQWVKEIHAWWPKVRVAVLHNSGSYKGSVERLIRSMLACNGVIVAAYSSVHIHQDFLIPQPWHYVILDEGHKIRNPDAQITIACKQLKTHHRIILSGSPMQNNLKELWSLFDFVFPGKLGTLPEFMQHVSVPIVQGGYSNATQIQVQTAYKCACMLRDTISPYLLRRMKADVKEAIQLPAKSEQVLFCRLTPEQRDVYKEYLDSKECQLILGGRYMVFPGLVTLRKICNHPDICTGGLGVADMAGTDGPVSTEILKYGHHTRSGKMTVIMSLLKIWKKQSHRVLLFTQSRQMLDILETFVKSQGYEYFRMDGSTPIASRQPLISTFNQDKSKFVFLLTTRVGGLGVNLTGANRVVIFDPDWNPSTDTQARERAWRIGQRKDVTVYRLLTTGTIEEKIYHRQIFKQFLANRVLNDPRQRRFFKSNDLFELFTLTDDSPDLATETSAIFAGTGSNIAVKPKKRKNRFDEMKDREKIAEEESVELVEELGLGEDSGGDKQQDEAAGPSDEDARKKALWELAKKLSKQMSGKKDGSDVTEEVPEEKAKEKLLSQKRQSSGATSSKPSTSQRPNDKSAHRHKHKRHKKKDAKFEGERVPLLAKQRDYKQANQTEEKEATSNRNDEYVLHKLFKKAGVHSALKHDTIMEAGQPDFALVDAEAAKVASQAAKALKQSRSACLKASRTRPGVPTWTGKEGAAGAPKPRFGQKRRPGINTTGGEPDKKAKLSEEASVSRVLSDRPSERFNGASLLKTTSSANQQSPLSSTQLLSLMKARKLHSDSSSDSDSDETQTSHSSHRSSVSIAEEHMELMQDIRTFIAFGASIDGKATTQEIMDQFKDKVSPEQAAHFKAMLRQICHHDKTSGVGVWTLKAEFR